MFKGNVSNYFSAFLVVIALIFTLQLAGVSSLKVHAQCPTGFTSTTVTITVGGCDYDVQLCYKCRVVNVNPTEIDIVGFKKHDPTCVPVPPHNVYQALKVIETVIGSYSWIYSNLCGSAPPVLPCDDNTPIPDWDKLYEKSYSCYRLDLATGWYLPCDLDIYCLQTTYFCFDGLSIRRNGFTTTQIGTPTCTKYADDPTLLPGECFVNRTTGCD